MRAPLMLLRGQRTIHHGGTEKKESIKFFGLFYSIVFLNDNKVLFLYTERFVISAKEKDGQSLCE